MGRKREAFIYRKSPPTMDNPTGYDDFVGEISDVEKFLDGVRQTTNSEITEISNDDGTTTVRVKIRGDRGSTDIFFEKP